MVFPLPYHLIIITLLLQLPFSTLAQAYNNVTLGTSLTAGDSSSWVSPSGEFALGFQQIGEGGFLLAIWFNKIPERTIIWSANRDQLVQKASKAQLATTGRFVLNDPQGKEIWSSDPTVTGVAYGAMLDTGNFVLVSNSSSNRWQSFNYPTDTLVPSQIMNRKSVLIARFSETNYSRGRFQFTLQDDGDLVSYTRAFPRDTVDFAYWSTNSVGDGFQFIYNSSGYIHLTARNGTILYQLDTLPYSTTDFYQRSIIDFDGVFRQYTYPKTDESSSGKWPMAWSAVSNFVPPNICTAVKGQTGTGACGYNSYCRLTGDQTPKCECPIGYTFYDLNDTLGGCVQTFVPQSCNKENNERGLFALTEMPKTDWSYSEYQYIKDVNEDWCREACLGDCYCAVAIFNNNNCWKKKLPLFNGRSDSSEGGKALIKFRTNNSTSHNLFPIRCLKKKDRSTLILIGSVLLGSSVFLNIFQFLETFLRIFPFGTKKKKPQSNPAIPGLNVRCFSYKELEMATDGFKEEIGRGAFATVYRGVVQFKNKEFVAVKKLDKMASEVEKEFEAEVSAIGRTNHKNLVKLLGFCSEGEHRLLVYEFMSKGSLSSYLFANPRPNWNQRIKIAVGTARGLFYLHEECSTQIIHCDIKPQNLLLDNSYIVKISDFGLAKLLKSDQTQTMTVIRGTKGYVAPEWWKNTPIMAKVDVYSFGIVLLELICCKKNVRRESDDDNWMTLADWALDCYLEKRLLLLVENDEEAMNDMKTVEKFVEIALWCIQDEPSLRPTMKNVVQMLEGTTDVSVPPSLSSFQSSI